jgi:hypothetical protein
VHAKIEAGRQTDRQKNIPCQNGSVRKRKTEFATKYGNINKYIPPGMSRQTEEETWKFDF